MPINNVVIIENLKIVSLSFRNKKLSNKANKMEVSLKEDTIAIGRKKQAQTTIA